MWPVYELASVHQDEETKLAEAAREEECSTRSEDGHDLVTKNTRG